MTVQIDFLGRSHFFSHPIEIIQTHSINEVLDCLAKVESYTQSGYYAAGYIAYEAAPAFNAKARVHKAGELPLLWFGIYFAPCASPREDLASSQVASAWIPNVDHEAYRRAISTIKSQIQCGNTYQTNYTLRLDGHISADPYAYYLQLKRAQRSEYCAYLDLGEQVILSASPELFFHYKDGMICTKPMKGTAPRGATMEQDTVNCARLFTEKNRAENMMIVDLLRNDLNQIARTGTVTVDSLFKAEKYPTVWQLTSTVRAEIPRERSLREIFRALFPCGSITGAPKLRTMQLIAELETAPRGVYCGAIGMISPNQEATFNVAIRTLTLSKRTGEAQYGVGGGITWDSTAEDEYQEVLDKALILTHTPLPDALLETLLLEKGYYFLLERHLERLKISATYFDFPYDETAVRKTLQDVGQLHQNQTMKVRLLLKTEGQINVEYSPLSQTTGPLDARLARAPIVRDNRFLYHKTTKRDCYPAVSPGQEYLLFNENGELTEFVQGNLALLCDGIWYTPPITSGLLAGTFRAQLIAEGLLHEKVLYLDDLKSAQKIALINSVRRWQTVQWHET